MRKPLRTAALGLLASSIAWAGPALTGFEPALAGFEKLDEAELRAPQCADPSINNRIALVIGDNSSSFPGVGPDVRGMSALLESSGWTVIVSLDETNDALRARLRDIEAMPARCDVIVYFSGGGGLIDGEQAIAAPSGPEAPARPLRPWDAISVEEVLARVSGDRTVALFDTGRTPLDARRDGDRPPRMLLDDDRRDGTTTGGLETSPPANTVLAYGTRHGCNATDTSAGGVFTRLLLRELEADPSTDIRVVLDRVRIRQGLPVPPTGEPLQECERVDVTSTLPDAWSLATPRSATPWAPRSLNLER